MALNILSLWILDNPHESLRRSEYSSIQIIFRKQKTAITCLRKCTSYLNNVFSLRKNEIFHKTNILVLRKVYFSTNWSGAFKLFNGRVHSKKIEYIKLRGNCSYLLGRFQTITPRKIVWNLWPVVRTHWRETKVRVI